MGRSCWLSTWVGYFLTGFVCSRGVAFVTVGCVGRHRVSLHPLGVFALGRGRPLSADWAMGECLFAWAMWTFDSLVHEEGAIAITHLLRVV